MAHQDKDLKFYNCYTIEQNFKLSTKWQLLNKETKRLKQLVNNIPNDVFDKYVINFMYKHFNYSNEKQQIVIIMFIKIIFLNYLNILNFKIL